MEDFLGDSDQHKGIQPSKQQPVTVAWISGLSQFLINFFYDCHLVVVFMVLNFKFGLIYVIK
jgi:hypothetical protein